MTPEQTSTKSFLLDHVSLNFIPHCANYASSYATTIIALFAKEGDTFLEFLNAVSLLTIPKEEHATVTAFCYCVFCCLDKVFVKQNLECAAQYLFSVFIRGTDNHTFHPLSKQTCEHCAVGLAYCQTK